MRTPAGNDCKYFYGDYFRGREIEECRLIGNQPPPNNWKPALCKTCPVPDLLMANACEYMNLSAHVRSVFLGISKRVVVSAFCTKTNRTVDRPQVGCGECHPLPPVFMEFDK